MLKTVDPEYYNTVDLANGVRIQRALEVSLTAGVPYSRLVNQPPVERPFHIEKTVVTRPRELLRERIAQRVEQIVKLVAGDEYGQIFITDTNRDHLDLILSRSTLDYKLFHVDNGEIEEIKKDV